MAALPGDGAVTAGQGFDELGHGLRAGVAGCTLPVFLAAVGTSLQLHGLAAWTGDGRIRHARALGRHTGWASGSSTLLRSASLT